MGVADDDSMNFHLRANSINTFTNAKSQQVQQINKNIYCENGTIDSTTNLLLSFLLKRIENNYNCKNVLIELLPSEKGTPFPFPE